MTHIRKIVSPPVISGETFSTALHEIGHVLSEPCSGGLHQPDPSVRDWLHCVECERLAWEKALTLAPFTRQMFNRLRQSLIGFYVTRTPAPAAAVNEAARVASGSTYADLRLRRSRDQLRSARLDYLISQHEEHERLFTGDRRSK